MLNAGGAHWELSEQGALAQVPEGCKGQYCLSQAPHLTSDVTKAWPGPYSLQKGPGP